MTNLSVAMAEPRATTLKFKSLGRSQVQEHVEQFIPSEETHP